MTQPSQPPFIVAVGAAVASTGTPTVVWPSHVYGDIGVLLVQTDDQNAATPSGWTPFTNSPQSTGGGAVAGETRLSMFWKRTTTNAEPSLVLADSGNHTFGAIITVRGCPATGDPTDITAGDVDAVGNTAITIPGLTTTIDQDLVLACASHAFDGTNAASGQVNASLTGLVESLDASTSSGNGGGLLVYSGVKTAAGVVSATTATYTSSAKQARLAVALKPLVPGALVVAGYPISVAPGSVSKHIVRVGSSLRSFAGNLRSAVRAEKREWNLRTILLPDVQATSIETIVALAAQLTVVGDIIGGTITAEIEVVDQGYETGFVADNLGFMRVLSLAIREV